MFGFTLQMEFCEKSTLKHCIEAGLHQDQTRVWRLFREIIEGLDHIHEQVRYIGQRDFFVVYLIPTIPSHLSLSHLLQPSLCSIHPSFLALSPSIPLHLSVILSLSLCFSHPRFFFNSSLFIFLQFFNCPFLDFRA